MRRARTPRKREAVGQRQRLRPARRGLAQQVGHALVVHHAQVGPAAQVEREQVHARVAQPVEVGGARDVRERHDDPCPILQDGWRLSRGGGRHAAARRRGPIGALRARRQRDQPRGDKQDE
ncbi:MAG: hypothetical protein HY275_02725 [Gemmatimonadetes bacterium]|nr:hypothetical protein [Gemmatimonadota bacterium]